MSLSKRNFICGAGLVGLALLSGCSGLRPLYSENGTASSLQNNVHYTVPSGRIGYELREGLEAQLGRPSANAAYHLTVSVKIEEDDLGITDDDTITRQSVRGTANFRLTGPAGFETISDSVYSLTGYSTTGSTYATRAAQRDAQERMVTDLARRIAVKSASVFEGRVADENDQ